MRLEFYICCIIISWMNLLRRPHLKMWRISLKSPSQSSCSDLLYPFSASFIILKMQHWDILQTNYSDTKSILLEGLWEEMSHSNPSPTGWVWTLWLNQVLTVRHRTRNCSGKEEEEKDTFTRAPFMLILWWRIYPIPISPQLFRAS